MFQRLQRLAMLLLLCALPFLLSACFLRSLFANVIYTDDIGEEVDEILTTVFSDSTAAICASTNFGYYECTYIVAGQIITSSFYLLSEFGLAGVLIDPVILQIPDDAGEIVGSYDAGSGPKPLQMTTTRFFQATPAITVTAEADHTFVILELPPSVANSLPTGDPSNGTEISYMLSFKQVQPISAPNDPVAVKLLLAGKATINERNYYVPLLPCVTDFATIPEIEIPVSDTPVNLQPTVGNLLSSMSNAVCDHQAYTYNAVPPPPKKSFLPTMIKQ